MTDFTPKKLSRRDALKILGAAAGAAALANLPSKWSTPELTQGVLPAHAQTSVFALICPADVIDVSCANTGSSMITINPIPPLNTPVQYDVSVSSGTVTLPSPNTGTALTNAAGQASIAFTISQTNTTVTVVWTLAGSGNCTQNITLDCP